MKIFILFVFLSLGVQAMAQSTLYDSVNRKRYKISQTGFIILGSWAALNIGAGLLGQQHTSGEQKEFFRANAIGGVIDLLFAGTGYFTSRRMARKPHDAAETFQKQAMAEKVFLFSVGLDLAAITYGFYTKERAARFEGGKKDWLKGAGNALILQGAFLTFFDGILYLLQTKNGSRLHQKLQNLSLGPAENGFGIICRF